MLLLCNSGQTANKVQMVYKKRPAVHETVATSTVWCMIS